MPADKSQEHSPSQKEGGAIESEVVKGKRRAIEDPLELQRSKIEAQKAEIFRLRSSRERHARRYREAKGRIAGWERHIQEVSRANKEVLGRQDRHIKAMEDELARTEELLAARMTELAKARSLLSTTDRRSEAEVLAIVHDLNENIFQVAAKLTDEWEKLESSRTGGPAAAVKRGADALSQFYGPALVNLAFDRDPTAVTFLVQSCLCHLVSQITLSWRRDRGKELTILGTVYKSISASEVQAVSARWRALTHRHLTEPSSQYSASITHRVKNVLWITGSFASMEDSLTFVKAKASNGIEIINRLALRLESMFMADITSTDMYLLFEAAGTPFDDTRMSKEFWSNQLSTSRRGDKVAGTTGVGVARASCGERGEAQRMKYMSKAKVVLESDLAQ